MQNMLRLVASVTLVSSCALAPSGCRLFGGAAPANAQFMLSPELPSAAPGPKLGSISIREFSALAPFDMSAFVYRNTDGTWRADPYDGFVSEPTLMVASALVAAFDASSRFDLVAYDSLAARTDLLLEGIIEDFHSDFSAAGAHESIVRLRVYISRRHGAHRGVVFASAVEGRAQIASQSPGAVADALSAATGAALAKIVEALPQGFPELAMQQGGERPAEKP